MNSAIERLAAQLMHLSDDEWTRAKERWEAGWGWETAFGPAWEEISERLSEIDWRAIAAIGADEVHGATAPPATVRPWDQA